MILFGDSHAAQWFPAMERLAIERSWRLISLTKSGCTPAWITVWDRTLKRPDSECDVWRDRVVERVAAEGPDLLIVASSHPYPSAANGAEMPADDGAHLAAGLEETLRRLVPIAGTVALVGDTPKWDLDPPECLSAHLDQVLDCTETRQDMIDEAWLHGEMTMAADSGAAFVDPTNWACPTDPCTPVVGRYLVYRDQHHLATPYVVALRNRLAAALPDPGSP